MMKNDAEVTAENIKSILKLKDEIIIEESCVIN